MVFNLDVGDVAPDFDLPTEEGGVLLPGGGGEGLLPGAGQEGGEGFVEADVAGAAYSQDLEVDPAGDFAVDSDAAYKTGPVKR